MQHGHIVQRIFEIACQVDGVFDADAPGDNESFIVDGNYPADDIEEKKLV